MEQGLDEKVWVVFTGEADMPILRVLRAGFRHCYLVMREGNRWVSLDPKANNLEIITHLHLPADFDLPAWIAARDATVVEAWPRAVRAAPFPLCFLTCVEIIKRCLRIPNRRIVTPYQLYKHLKEEERVREDSVSIGSRSAEVSA